jgi:hypothetical protein
MRIACLAAALALPICLAACADGTGGYDPTPMQADAAGANDLGTVAPGAEGLYEGDPLAGPDLDPADAPL